MNTDLFECKDEWKDYETEELEKMLPNYFIENGDIRKSAYLNWRFEKERDVENQFYEMGKAYFETAIILIDDCLEDNTDKKADTWIFPILFNVVHGIEIYLKGFNSQIKILDKIEKEECQEGKIEGKHDIHQLCNVAISLIKQSSHKDLLPEFEFIRKFIEFLYENTNDMTFARYPINRKSEPHFYVKETENVVINLVVFRIWVCKIFGILDSCTGFVDFKIEEIRDWLGEMRQEYQYFV